MNANLQRGLLLYEQSRWAQAQAEFQQAVLADPQDAYTRALLALTLSEQERYDAAESEIGQALQIDPAFPFVHYARASVLNDRNDFSGALAAIGEAVQLDPEDADYRALQAQVFLNLRRWDQALAAAEQGLALDPEHISCTNLRAIALVKLGRNEQAGQTIDAALSRNPENSTTHANQGWTLLDAGKPEKALQHFRESLRLDPENEWARQGTVEALKGRYFIYSLLLKYFLWMSRLSQQMQWAVILGGYFGMRLLRGLTKSNPAIAPYVLPIQILYLAFVFLSWTAEPLFNLLLRLNKFGRLVLSRQEIVASNWVGAFTGIALFCIAAALALHPAFWFGAAVFGFSVLPLAAVFKCQPGWPRLAMIAYTGVVLFVGIAALLAPLTASTPEQMKSLVGTLGGIFAIGIVLAAWVANFLIAQRVRK